MLPLKLILRVFILFPLLVIHSDDALGKKKDRAARDFRHADINGDKKLDFSEWNRRGNFERLDRNGDGYLNLKEVRTLYKGHDDKTYSWPPKNMPKPGMEIDASIEADRVGRQSLDKETLCGISRPRDCDMSHAVLRGLLETGTGPVFPKKAVCPGMDDFWAMDYSNKRNRTSYHGGIDLPAPWGTPMRAAAAGSVVAIYDGEGSKRGIEIILRHSPEQTGLPVWTYTGYGHLDRIPRLKVGQRVKLGQILGPTGNSGNSARGNKQSKTRRPAIHFVVFYSSERQYSENIRTIIPVDGRWMDPMAFYRQKPPFDSPSVKALPDKEKGIAIPVLFENGETYPAKTKLVWPYACSRD